MKRVTVSVEQYRKLVAMQAWEAWRKLPMQTRIWIDVDDMIEDGMKEAWKLTKTFNPSWASFGTAVYHRIHRYFINEYLEFHSAYKRGWMPATKNHKAYSKTRHGNKVTFEFQSMEALMKTSENESFESSGIFPALVTSPDSIFENVVTECFVIPTLEKVYKEATPRLQEMIYVWFLSTNVKERNCTKGKPFKKAAKEFRELCKHEQLSCNDCLHLVRSPSCLDKLSRDLFHIPYSLEAPCPAAERVL
jgi:hypothetical protein